MALSQLIQQQPTIFLGLCVLAYLLGSVSYAVIVCKVMGLPDPRSEGSQNPGATNVLRVGGKFPAALTLVGDITKGIIPIIIGYQLGFRYESLGFIGAFAFIGHLWPVFFGFNGGKGVATALGVITILSWKAGLAVMCIWAVLFGLKRISSLASIGSWLFAPLAIYFLAPQYIISITIMTFILLMRHRQNIKDLLSGNERSFSKEKE